MTLRTSVGAYLVALHLVLLGCATLLLPAWPLYFVGAELALMASLVLGCRLLHRALAPLGYTTRFHDLLQDQQYASRLAAPGQRELDELVNIFNTMLATLHRERLAEYWPTSMDAATAPSVRSFSTVALRAIF